jgi:hypothetical protein
MNWQPKDQDRKAAWELYVELITRIATQRLDPEEGDEAAALKSIHELFPLTRETIRRNGRYCINFTRIAVVVLNQKVRPFTARWHPRMLAGSSAKPTGKRSGRSCATCRRTFANTHACWPIWPTWRT